MKHLLVIISVLLAQTAFAQRFELQTYKPSNDILKAVLDNDKEKLKSLAPTINRLLAHYRSLQLPDQYISRWFSS